MLFRKDMNFAAPTVSVGVNWTRAKGALPQKVSSPPRRHCRSFQYDPLRRKPPEMAQLDFSSSVRKISPYKMRKKDCMVTHAIFFHQCAVSARTGSSSRKSREMHHRAARPTSA